MKDFLKRALSTKRNLIVLYALLAIGASVQALTSGMKTYVEGGNEYKTYNNYIIFKNSFNHLINDQDIYTLYPEEQWDLFKYTPTFSAFFGLFALFPDELGLNLWNLLNAFMLLGAIYYLPRLKPFEKGIVLLILAVELMTSMQNDQSNALIAGLLVFAFGFLEKKQPMLASLAIVFSVFIKLFGVVGFALFIFYPKKWKLALYSALWSLIMLAIPLLFIDFEQYTQLMESYLNMLSNDHAISYGYSVMGGLNSWFSIDVNKNIVVLIGTVLFLIPLARRKAFSHFLFRYLTLSSVLIWVVIFNHRAESPTFIIAMTGVALWFIQSQKSKINLLLFVFAFVLTSLSPTDIFPRFIRDQWVIPYVLKALPCILVWLKVEYDLLTLKTISEVQPSSE